MIEYWGDSNIFIESRKGPYAFDIVPGFWILLDQKVEEGVFASSVLNYDEILDTNSDAELTTWIKARRIPDFLSPPMLKSKRHLPK